MTEEEFRTGVLEDGSRLMQAPRTTGRLVVLESPYAGAVRRNVAYARACMADSLDRGEIPFASHLLYTQRGILDDKDPADRALGIAAGLAWGAHAMAAVFYTDLGMSRGMIEAQAHWYRMGKLIVERQLPPELIPQPCAFCHGTGKSQPLGLRACDFCS